MSSDTTSNGNTLDDVEKNLFISVGVLAGAVGVLLIVVVGLIFWILSLSKRIKEVEYFSDFKLKRPKLVPTVSDRTPISYNNPEPIFNEEPVRPPKKPLSGQNYPRSDLNPIASRGRTDVDHGNFSFGAPNKSPSYLHQNNKYY